MPFANHAGVHIYYEVEGHGPPLVLHHSLARGLDAWRDFGYVPALKDDFQLILLDARGHGASDKPHDPAAYAKELMVGDVVAVLDDLGIERAHFWGYSLGASVGFQIGRHALGRFHSLVLGGNSPYGSRGEAASKFIGQLRAGMQLGAAKGMEAVLALQEKLTGPLPEPMKTRLLATDPLAMLALLDAMQAPPDVAGLLAALTLPCLVYCGDADPAYAGAGECVQQMPSATFVALPGLDHAAGLARSDVVLPHVKQFLAGAQAGVFNRRG